MRVVLSADMEAVAHISDVREVLACRPEYWEVGRRRLTEDVVAAAAGLLDGGASEVILLDNHGSGNPWNVLLGELPSGVRAESWDVFGLPRLGVDGMLQIGYHPRAGVAGFVPHSYVPGLRLWVGGEEISESHGRIWAARTALLGIVGHAMHERTLGSLAGTPFLVVQDGNDSHRAFPVYRDAAESAEAIREFACRSMQAVGAAPRPRPPGEVSFDATVDAIAEPAASAMEDAGWNRTGDDEFNVGLSGWDEARGPLAAAMVAAFQPFLEDMTALDLTSRQSFERQEPARLQRLTSTFLERTDRSASR
jgi:D-amino peptidase